MNKREVPEPWASAMKKAGVVDRRWGNPSWSELARRVGATTSTVIAMADGVRKADLDRIDLIAQELRVQPETVASWIGASKVGQAYEPPAEARLLDDDQRKALDRLIKTIVAPVAAQVEEPRARPKPKREKRKERRPSTLDSLIEKDWGRGPSPKEQSPEPAPKRRESDVG